MRYCVVDFESASRADLIKVGAWKYASDFSTVPLCLSIKVFIEDKPTKVFCLTGKMLHGLDPRLMALASDPAVIFICHNGSFEQAMWISHCVPMGYPSLPPERWHDTMAVAAMKALPLGLDALVSALDLPIKKDMEGHAHMLKMCKPDRNDSWDHHTPENLEKLYRYCNADVEAQAGVYHATRGLGSSERHNWILDQKVQQRGFKIDTKFVDACIDVLDQVRVPMTERFRELTGLNPTQREKVLNWVNDQGVPLGDMKKETLNTLLDPGDEFEIGDDHIFTEPLPYLVHEVVTLRRSLASSSVSKLQRMLMCASSLDGRVRYATQYHGARTGRDAGRLVQIQNYPRGEIGDRQGLTADILAEAIMTRDLPTIRELWGDDIFSAIISSLRSAIVPEKGKILASGDFAAVEARNLLSAAGQHDRVDQMHSGQDVYSETASLIYRRPINRKLPGDAKEGQTGKNTFLGCLSARTLVLTNIGWKRIIHVKNTDLLWDGLDWVTHEGLAYKGYRETLNLYGLRLTKNHEVFDGEKWFRADESTNALISRALAFAKDHGPLSDTPIPNRDFLRGLCAIVIVKPALFLWSNLISVVENLRDVIYAQKEKRAILEKCFGDMPISAQIKTIGHVCLIGYQPSKIDAPQTANLNTRNHILDEELESLPNGVPRVAGGRSDLLNRNGNFSRIYSLFPDGTTLFLKLTVSKMTETIHRAIFGSLQSHKIWEIKDKLTSFKVNLTRPLKKLACSEHVYDLINAGPHQRFTVMTYEGPLLVHNSGYGLGPVGFRARFAPKDSIEFAQIAINTYRQEVAPKVPVFWYGLFKASVDAVWCSHAKTYSYEGIEFRREGDFLTMRLWSGRKIWYHRPYKTASLNPSNGQEYPSWSFMSYQGKRFRRHLAWHGMVTADCIQGSARDLMTEAMSRAEAAGYFTIFKVHDELVFEETDRDDLVSSIKQIMEDISPWVIERRFRVKAEVEKMMRYRK